MLEQNNLETQTTYMSTDMNQPSAPIYCAEWSKGF